MIGMCAGLIAAAWLAFVGDLSVGLPENPHALEPTRACGVYCVKFLASYLGREKSYAEIAAWCAPGPQGTTLEDIRRACERLGLHVMGVKAELGNLYKVGRPAILSLRHPNGEGHFVVWLDYDPQRDSVRLFSPPQWVGWESRKALNARYTGVALIVSREALPSPLVVSRGVSPTMLALWSIVLAVCGGSLIALLRSRRGVWRGTAACLLGVLMGLVQGCTASNDVSLSAASREGLVDKEGSSDSSDEAREVYVGRVIEGVELAHTFRVRNTTDQPLRIMNVDKSCSCQSGNVRIGTVVAPGEVLEVPFRVPTKGTRGKLRGWLRLHTDSSDESLRSVYLELSAELEAKLRAVPTSIVFGNFQVGETPTRVLRVESTAAGLVEMFQEARSSSPHVSIALRERSPGALVFEVAVRDDSRLGEVQGTLTLTFSTSDYPTLCVPVLGNRVGTLKVLPSEVIVDRWPGEMPRARLLRVVSTAGRAFRITRVDCPDWVQIAEGLNREAVVHELKLQVMPASGGRDANIVVHTDHLGEVTCPVRFTSAHGS
uniref:DUF1573 domain-containing protein n=1 Tax=Schlesneria paludicola TaxID=360056 RepID=A0A7C4LKX5_9PLAN